MAWTGKSNVSGATGGNARKWGSLAADLGGAGRYGDTMVAHINPKEAAILAQMRGAPPSINPKTGLLEFFEIDGLTNNPIYKPSTGGSQASVVPQPSVNISQIPTFDPMTGATFDLSGLNQTTTKNTAPPSTAFPAETRSTGNTGSAPNAAVQGRTPTADLSQPQSSNDPVTNQAINPTTVVSNNDGTSTTTSTAPNPSTSTTSTGPVVQATVANDTLDGLKKNFTDSLNAARNSGMSDQQFVDNVLPTWESQAFALFSKMTDPIQVQKELDQRIAGVSDPIFGASNARQAKALQDRLKELQTKTSTTKTPEEMVQDLFTQWMNAQQSAQRQAVERQQQDAAQVITPVDYNTMRGMTLEQLKPYFPGASDADLIAMFPHLQKSTGVTYQPGASQSVSRRGWGSRKMGSTGWTNGVTGISAERNAARRGYGDMVFA